MKRRAALKLLVTSLLAFLLPARAFARPRRANAPLRRIVFGSCIDQNAPQPIWSAVRRVDPELVVLLGDNIYSWTSSLEEKRKEYAKLDAQPDFRALRESAALVGTWDDNDYGKIDGGREYEHQEMSKLAFLEFFRVPADDPRRSRKGIYTAEYFGPPGRRVQVLLLDLRSFRSPLKIATETSRGERGPYAAEREGAPEMLGAEQWAWLERELREPAEVRIIASSIQVLASESGYEGWWSMPSERERLFKVLRDSGARGVILVSGDRHSAEISVQNGVLPYPLYDITASSFTRRRPVVDEPNALRVGKQYFLENFGSIEIDWHWKRAVIATRNAQGRIISRATLSFSS